MLRLLAIGAAALLAWRCMGDQRQARANPDGPGERCAVCGLTYAQYRQPDRLTFAEMKRELDVEYAYFSKQYPVRRSSVLGRLHEEKAAAWAEHRERCDHYAEQVGAAFGGAPLHDAYAGDTFSDVPWSETYTGGTSTAEVPF